MTLGQLVAGAGVTATRRGFEKRADPSVTPRRDPAIHLRFEHTQRHAALLQQRVVKIADGEGLAQRRLRLLAQARDRELPDLVAERLAGPGHVALHLALGVLAPAPEIGNRLLARPALHME